MIFIKIAIIDADLIGKKKHRFPNLACEKLSGYFKGLSYDVVLVTDYNILKDEYFDKIYLSKVFTDTPVPDWVLQLDNIEYNGTGFFYDKASTLPIEIEHHKPDYDLYSEWVDIQIKKGLKRNEFEYYLDYSIGFTTRGCFRRCEFCVNKNYTKVVKHSPLEEFVDNSRKYICLLDDNILGYGKWKVILEELVSTNKYFQYKQGMDERILTEEKCNILANSKYKGDFIFAFDNIQDKDLIIEKVKLWRAYSQKTTKFYVFCGFDRNDKWDDEFWKQDIIDTFERIKILMKYGCLPYIMRYERYSESPYRGTYINLARWCNQPSFFKKKSYRDFCIANQVSDKKVCASMNYLNEFEQDHPDVAKEYYNIRYEDLKLDK